MRFFFSALIFLFGTAAWAQSSNPGKELVIYLHGLDSNNYGAADIDITFTIVGKNSVYSFINDHKYIRNESGKNSYQYFTDEIALRIPLLDIDKFIADRPSEAPFQLKVTATSTGLWNSLIGWAGLNLPLRGEDFQTEQWQPVNMNHWSLIRGLGKPLVITDVANQFSLQFDVRINTWAPTKD